MPTYEYQCESCGTHFEVWQSIKDKPIKRCRTCKGKLRRLIGSGGGFIFKGSGFYSTDYRSSEYKKKEKDEAKPAEKSKEPEKKEGKKDT